MPTRRKKWPADVRARVLHEAAYQCGNPRCRAIITLDLHHLEPVSEGGPDTADNLLPLCGYCHDRHHQGLIPLESVRAWKMLLVALNEAYDRKTLDLLAALGSVRDVYVTGDGLLGCANAIASGLVSVTPFGIATFDPRWGFMVPKYRIDATDKGRQLLAAWIEGDQAAVARLASRLDQPPPVS